MGNSRSKKKTPRSAAKATESRKNIRTCRLVLLGISQSGKSTIFKQMKIIQMYNQLKFLDYLNFNLFASDGGYSYEERLSFTNIIYQNLISQMKILAESSMRIIKNLSADTVHNIKILLDASEQWDIEIGKLIKQIWADQAIKDLLTQNTKSNMGFSIAESAEHFFNSINRILAPNYVPNEEDVIKARINTVGLNEAVFNFKELNLILIDAGGQKSERSNWIHCFQDVTALIYVCSLNDYDQHVARNNSAMRMQESLQLFEEVCNAPYFKTTELVLFLNKNDLFKEKIKNVDLNVCFSNYTGGCNYDEALKFIKKTFFEKIKNNRDLYIHVTCAVNSQNVEFVFNSVQRMVLKKLLTTNFTTINSKF